MSSCFPWASFFLSLMSSRCRSVCPPTTCVPASCLCHPWSLWGAVVDSPTNDLHRRSPCTQLGALEHEPSTVKSMPVSCISPTIPCPSVTMVSYHTLVFSNRGQLFLTQNQMEDLQLEVHNLIQSIDNRVAQFSNLMISFFLAQSNEEKKKKTTIKIYGCYSHPFLPCAGFWMGPRIVKCPRGWRDWASLYR